MQTVNIHEAKTQLSRLIARAEQGESFLIARAGKPVVKVSPIPSEGSTAVQRLGFMRGMLQIPDDFDRMGEVEIQALFSGDGT